MLASWIKIRGLILLSCYCKYPLYLLPQCFSYFRNFDGDPNIQIPQFEHSQAISDELVLESPQRDIIYSHFNKQLLRMNNEGNEKSVAGFSALIMAAARGNEKVVAYLLKNKKTNVNLQDSRRETAIWKFTTPSITKALSEVNPEIGRHNIRYQFIIEKLLVDAKPKCSDIPSYLPSLLKVKAVVYSEALHDILKICPDDIDLVKWIVEENAETLDEENDKHETPLNLKVQNLEIVKYLIERGANVNTHDG